MPPKAKRRRKEGDHVGVGHQAALESVARSDAVDKDKPDAKRLQTSKERAQKGVSCFLMKSEPTCYSIDDLAKEPDGKTCWEGVRNYQARNLMQSCTVGDKVLFYHSCCKPPGVVGLATVCREAYPDYTCWDAKHSAYDPKSTEAKPRWTMVDIQFVRKLKRLISLDELKQHKDGALKDLALFKTSRLSVQPVSADEYDFIVGLENVTEGEKKVNGDEK